MPLEVLVVCRPEVLRAGLARLLAGDRALTVTSAGDVPEQPRRPASVAVLCDRGLADPAGVCRELLDGAARHVVVVAGRPDVDAMLESLAAAHSA